MTAEHRPWPRRPPGCASRGRRCQSSLGHAVVFPDCDFPAGVEAVSAPRRLVLDAGDLAGDVEARLEALFRAWGEGRAAEKLTKKWIAAGAARPRAALLAC